MLEVLEVLERKERIIRANEEKKKGSLVLLTLERMEIMYGTRGQICAPKVRTVLERLMLFIR